MDDDLLKLKLLIRIRKLEVDYNTTKKDCYRFARQEFLSLLAHLEKDDWIIADIECGLKYLSDDEKKLFKNIIKNRKVK